MLKSVANYEIKHSEYQLRSWKIWYMSIIRIPSFHYPRNLGISSELEKWQIVSKYLQERQCSLSVTWTETILGLFCVSFRKNLLVCWACCLLITQPLWYQPMSEHSVLEPGFDNWRAVLPIFGKLSLFKHSDVNINQALTFCFTSKTTKTGPTIMKKTVVSAEPWSQLSFHYYYYMESGLILLFPSSNIWIIFSQKIRLFGSPLQILEMYEWVQIEVSFLLVCLVCFCFVLCQSTHYLLYSTKRRLNIQAQVK